jgi:hypothetical protein
MQHRSDPPNGRLLATTLIVSLTILGASVCGGSRRNVEGPASPSSVRPQTEEEWIVTDTLRHIGRRAGNGSSAPTVAIERVEPRDAKPAYRVRLGGRAATLVFKDHLWSPQALAPAAGLVVGSSTGGACESLRFLGRLLTPTLPVLTELDDLISRRMTAEPGNPCLHESAAALIGAMEMREVYSTYADARPALNRMAAHLAIARALRGRTEQGPEGRIGDLMLRAIAFRHDGFPEELQARAAAAGPDERSWLRVISLYAVQDWRELENPANASLAERRAALLALANKTDAARVLAFVDEYAPEPIPDWPLLVFQRYRSVESCGRFAGPAMAMTLAEAKEAHRRVRGQELADDQIVAALNEEREDGTARRVLDWPLWAAFEQRNLLASILQQYSCLQNQYGLPEEAAEFRAFAESRYGGLRLFPFALRAMRRTREESERAVSRAVQLVKERPELITWNNWVYLPTPSVFGPAPAGVPQAARWFAPLLPFGTAFDYNSRLWGGPEAVRKDQALLESIRSHVFHALIRKVLAEAKWGKHPPLPELKALYGSIVAFDLDAMTSIAEAAEKSDPVEFKAAASARCELSIDLCGWLASYLKDHGEEEEAARVYQRWVDGARDRVRVSNSVKWLVDYYANHGQRQKAASIAQMAAEVGSQGGLETMGGLLEKLDRNEEAERYFRQSYQRYGHPGALAEFLVRHQNQPRLKASWNRLLAEVFPSGRRPVRQEEFGQEQPRGAAIRSPGEESDDVGFEVGDVVVSVDGIRVESLNQLRLQRRMSNDTSTDVLCWRSGVIRRMRVSRDALGNQDFLVPSAPSPAR